MIDRNATDGLHDLAGGQMHREGLSARIAARRAEMEERDRGRRNNPLAFRGNHRRSVSPAIHGKGARGPRSRKEYRSVLARLVDIEAKLLIKPLVMLLT